MCKYIVLALAAPSVLSAPAAAAPFHAYHTSHQVKLVKTVKQRNGRTVVKTRQVVTASQLRRLVRGQRFTSRYAPGYRFIGSPRAYRLYGAPRG